MPKSQVNPLLAAIISPLHKLFMRWYFRLEIEGLEHLPGEGPVVIAPNHSSRWDALVVRYLSRRDMRFMASSDEFGGLQGWLMRALGAFAVDTQHASTEALRHSLELLASGRAVVIFPEGGIHQDGQVHPLKPGIGRLAVMAPQSCVVPVTIAYEPGCRPRVRVKVSAPLSAGAYLERSGGRSKSAASALTLDLYQQLTSSRK